MNTLRLFCDVGTYRSFSRAAAKQGITQSAASQRIGHLEKRLGVMLIDRSVRPLALTAAGELYLREGLDLLERYDELQQQVARFKPDPVGEVRVDAIYSAGIDLLNQVKDSFEAQAPQAKVILEYKRPEQVHEAVRRRQCDVGIVSYPKTWKGVSMIPLRDERMAVIASGQHFPGEDTWVQPTDLADRPMVTFESSLPAGQAIRRYLKEHGVTPRITNTFDNIDTIKHAVMVTDQFSILPERTVQREVAGGLLRAIELRPVLVRPMGIIFAKQGRGNGAFAPTTQAFVDHLLAQAGPNSEGERQQEAQPAAEG
jgi:DNA-binding transcriptional LysR family regulator